MFTHPQLVTHICRNYLNLYEIYQVSMLTTFWNNQIKQIKNTFNVFDNIKQSKNIKPKTK